jgi:hypothetical protein
MLDLLLKPAGDPFLTDPVCLRYLTLIAHLCRRDPTFREARGEAAWEKVAGLLDRGDACPVYWALAAMAECMPKVASRNFPSQAAAAGLRRPSEQAAVLSLLLRVLPRSDADDILAALLPIARTDQTATMVLWRFAEKPSAAAWLVAHSAWMGDRLPRRVGTFTLFAIIARHETLHRELIAQENTAKFFLWLAREPEDENFLSPMVQLLRRLPLTAKFLRGLDRQGVLEAVRLTMAASEREEVVKAALLFYDTVGRVAWVEQMEDVCATVLRTFKKRKDPLVREMALKVAVVLAAWPDGARKFAELDVRQALAGQRDPAFEAQAKRLLRRIEAAV